jgi:hypothetical protein
MRIHNKEHFDEVKAFAERIGMTENLQERLDTLKRIAFNMKGELVLSWDFAPHSLTWSVVKENGDCVYNGGLIYHGSHDRGGDGGPPTFSVSLNPSRGWEIHS